MAPLGLDFNTAADLVRRYEYHVIGYAQQYLGLCGWFDSIRTQQSVDADGPIPWITYPALHALRNMVRPGFRVLEYGSGNSSRWWRERVTQLVSVEHDPDWVRQIACEPRSNHRVIHAPLGMPVPPEFAAFLDQGFFAAGLDPAPGNDAGRNLRAGLLSREFAAYACQVLHYPKGFFDVIVIDGMARVLTAWLASQYVSEHGFILFDNSDRDEYAAGYRYLQEAGFRRVDFWGSGPINPYEWCTSVFTRSIEVF